MDAPNVLPFHLPRYCAKCCFSKTLNVRGGAISASGHWVIEEQPETLLRELLSFLP